ncbi:MAG: restriction endonuclease [Terracidiphilus sp.]|jgi:hypothetical protein
MRQNAQFGHLYANKDAFARARRFEKIVAEVLGASGFDVDLDSPAATPRQSDLLVEGNGEIYLWELKWHSRPATIDHVHGLRDRLRTMRPGVVGVLCSISGFTKTALDDVTTNRSAEVLLIDGYEICQVIDRGLDIADLLEKKRYQITRRARVWFLDGRKSSLITKPVPLPLTRECIDRATDVPYASMTTRGNDDLLFTRHPLMFGEYGPGVYVLRLRLDAIEELRELEHLIGLLYKEFHFADDPEFSIRQTNAMWAGVGAREFLTCAANIEARYAKIKTRLHHSEELWTFAEIRDGIMLLSIRQRSSKPYLLDSGELIIRATSLPIDLSSYRKVATALGEKRPSFAIESPLETSHFYFSRPVKISPLRIITITEQGEQIIVGMFVRNPFHRRPEALKTIVRENQGEQNLRAFEKLVETDVLGCAVKDWIPAEEAVTGWHLLEIGVAFFGGVWLLHCTCTWKDKKHWERHSPDDPALDSIPDFEAERLNREKMERELLAWRERRFPR